MASAARATWVMNPNACEKSRNSKTRWSFPCSTVQPFSFCSSAAISGSFNFVARIEATSAHFFEAVIAILKPFYLESDLPSISDYRAAVGHRATGVLQKVERYLRFLYLIFLFWHQLTRLRAITGVHVRNKIRAIQYGVGPIGASLVRLM